MWFVNLIKQQNVMESGEIKLSLPPRPRTHTAGSTEMKPEVVISLKPFHAVSYAVSELRDQDHSSFFDNFLIESFLSPSNKSQRAFSNLTVCSWIINKYSVHVIYVLFERSS